MNRVVLLIMLSGAVPAHAASFECAPTVTRVEALICSDAVLSLLDTTLASDYEKASVLLQYRSTDADNALSSKSLTRDQRQWLRRRNACRDSACIKDSYLSRVAELRRLNCKLDPDRECGRESAKILPITADGRVLLLSREECINGDGLKGFQDQAASIRVQADCIEAGIYDPCEDAGDRAGDAQCAWAHVEVANRRIRNAEARLVAIATTRYPTLNLSDNLAHSNNRWLKERDRFCEQQNRQFADAPVTQDDLDARRAAGETNFGEAWAHCLRRLAESRAGKLEGYVVSVNDDQSGNVFDQLRDFLNSQSQFAPPPPK